MNSRSIKVPVEDLKTASKKMQQYADKSADVFDRISNTLSRLEASRQWRGDSMAAIKAVTMENKNKYSELVNDLNNLAGLLEQFAVRISEEDQAIKSEINAE